MRANNHRSANRDAARQAEAALVANAAGEAG
jgi:hypothetical protein